MFDVMMMTALRTGSQRCGPCASVSRPSSRTCRSVLNTSGCVAFSISISNKTTEYGLAPHRLGGSCPPSSYADHVAGAGRRPGVADRVPLLVLARVQPDHVVLGVEQRGRERPGQLGLPDAGRAEEGERPDGLARVLDAGPGPDDGIGHSLHGFVLADDPLMQDLVEPQ